MVFELVVCIWIVVFGVNLGVGIFSVSVILECSWSDGLLVLYRLKVVLCWWLYVLFVKWFVCGFFSSEECN